MSPAWIAAFLALAALNLALVGVVLGVVRRALAVLEGGHSAPLMAQDGPPPGTPLPAFEGSTLDGRRVESSELLGEPAVLLFLAEGCEACDTLVLAMRSVRLRLTAARHASSANWLPLPVPAPEHCCLLAGRKRARFTAEFSTATSPASGTVRSIGTHPSTRVRALVAAPSFSAKTGRIARAFVTAGTPAEQLLGLLALEPARQPLRDHHFWHGAESIGPSKRANADIGHASLERRDPAHVDARIVRLIGQGR